MRRFLAVLLPFITVGCAVHSGQPISPVLYKVSTGETLTQIADRFSISLDTLSELNAVNDAARLREGTMLQLPEIDPAAVEPAMVQRIALGGKVPQHGIELGRARHYVARLVWPIRGARFSSPFGARRDNFHEGVDLSAPEGTEIYAAHDGEVVYAGRGLKGYGKMIVLQAEGIATVYAHNSSNRVEAGDRVRAGQEIARVGQTGDATGPHLHFEIRVQDAKRRYVAVDPLAFYRRVDNSLQMASADRPKRRAARNKG